MTYNIQAGGGKLENVSEAITIRLFNTHLDYRADPAIRQQPVTEVLGIIGASPGPTLLLGDLNAQPQAPELQPLLGKLKDVWSSGRRITRRS
jgi:endonuclease/exonuclease/phosphatase family metal-dependent hydrolase